MNEQPCPGSARANTGTKTAKKICSVYGCLNTKVNKPHLSFFSLPSEDDRPAQWLQLISREDLKDRKAHSYVVCEEHFDPLTIQGSAERKRLRKCAIPSLQLPTKKHRTLETQTEFKETLNKFAQTDFYVLKLDTSVQTPHYLESSLACVKKLKDELTVCKKRLKSADSKNLSKATFHKLCDKFLTKPLAEIVKAQTKLKFHAKGNRYSAKYKQFCINLFYTSPQAYKLLAQALCLPNARTLAKHSLPITTEVNEHLMSTLKVKVNNMTNSEKVCSVVVDAVYLRSNLYYNISLDKIIGLQEVNGVQSPVIAKYALVVMIRGLFGNWMQPIGFALLAECKQSEEISFWIEQLLEKLIDVGLDIRTFISYLGLDLLSEEKRQSATIDKPYFFIKNRKMYSIIDAMHLIKSLRNSFTLNDFHFQGRVAKFEYILQFYESDINKSLRLAPKLTESHIRPKKFEKANLNYAVQLLSHSVATAISCYIDFQAIHESAKDTVNFVKMINDLFDILNSSTVHSTCEFQQAFCGSPSQVTFMKKMLDFFKSLTLLSSTTGRDVTPTAGFITGFQMTITSILLLFEDLRLEGYNYLLTSRLNQDVTETFFGQIRNKNKRPSTRKFMTAFRKFFFSSIIKPSKQGNRLDDLSQLLDTEKMGFILGTETSEENIGSEMDWNDIHQEPNRESTILTSISSSDYDKIELPENNTLRYLCEHLLKKCISVHGDCQLFRVYVRNDKPQVAIMDVDNRDDSEDNTQIDLHEGFVIFVEEMERHYQNFFNNLHSNCKMTKSIVESMNNVPFDSPCPCFPIDYMKTLYVRTRIYITIKYNNEYFRKHGARARSNFSANNF